MKLGTTELLIVLAVVVLIFGPTQIPKLTRMFGKSVKSFKDGMGEDEEAKKVAEDADDKN
jgi:sec-independent protein translocase protein TatA